MNPNDSDLMGYLVRMVTPMKREFSVSLNVSQFMSEEAYAKEIIDQALQSKDERLRQCAAYARSKVFGPRAGADTSTVAATLTTASAATPTASAASTESVDEMRAKMLAKYRSSLR